MKKSLATFMVLAITAVIMGTLVFGVVYNSLDIKNTRHQDLLENKHQLQKNL